MLLSPISLDSNVLPGQVPALASSGAGATGFAEQLQLVAALAPPDASAPASLPLNSDDAAATAAPNAAGSQIPVQLKPLLVFASIPPAAPIAFHSTAELNIRGVVCSPIVPDPAPQAAVGSTILMAPPTVAAPEVRVAQSQTEGAPVTAATSQPVSNVPAAEVKPQEKIAPALQDAAPAIEEAPILASGLPQKSSTPETRVEHEHHAHAEKADAKSGETPDAQPQPAVIAQPQPAAPVPAPAALPVHMVLPAAQRFNRPLIPLGNRIPAAVVVATRTPIRTETPAAADPFNNDADPKAATPPTLPAEATKPLVATADQLAFAAKVQLAKPQTVTRNPEPIRAEPVHAEPVHSESHSQQQHSSHKDADPQFSMKAGETAAKPAARPVHASSTFEAHSAVSGELVSTAKPAVTASPRPASAASATAEDITPTRPEVPAAPMKDISVRIQSEQGENVDVRILHRAGDVQIAVKSASGETTQGLRHGLSELSDHLNATGYHAETWHPGQTTTAAENNADSGNSQQQHSQQQSQGDSQSHSGWSQQQGGRRDDNQDNRPRWIEELDSNISSSPETGLFHGLIR